MKVNTITKEQRDEIMARETKLREWMGKRCSYHPSELPADIISPTNEERAQVELYDFINDPPEKYFLYIRRVNCKGESDPKSMRFQATIWTGVVLGSGVLGHGYETPAFGRPSQRYPVKFAGVNGYIYHGTYYASSGDYARVKMSAVSKKRLAAKGGVQ